MPAIGSDSEPGADLDGFPVSREQSTRDQPTLSCHVDEPRTLKEADRRFPGGTADEDLIQWLSANRQAESHLAWTLRRIERGGAVPVNVVVLASELRRSERQHVIEHPDLSQCDHPVLTA